MPLFGAVQGFQPIAEFNYGARLFDRVRKTLKLTLVYATAYTSVGFLPVFPLIGIQIIGGSYFLVIGKPFPSLVLNLSQQFILLIPLLLILPRFFGLSGLLISFPIADFLATIITVVWLLGETDLRSTGG